MPRSNWYKHGFWNTLEHVVTRVADASSSLILLWALSPETFSKLALAQAVIAPFLFFFVSPETVLYRDFARWKLEGPNSFASRLRALRLFGWGKAQVAILLALVLSLVIPGSSELSVRFYSFAWALFYSLAPQIYGADREYLRLDLKMRELCVISLLHKSLFLGGTAVVALRYPGRVDYLAAVSVGVVVFIAVISQFYVNSVMKNSGASRAAIKGWVGIPIQRTIRESLQSFSLWSHLAGIVSNWIQTMDLFFLGVFRFPAREVGLYAAVLKLAGFAAALPVAFANLFSIWVGRRHVGRESAKTELRETIRLSLILFGITSVQALVLWGVAPFLFEFLSRGRWSQTEQVQMLNWLKWILIGVTLYCSTHFLSSWLWLRSHVVRLFVTVYVPWIGFSLFIYARAVSQGGFDLAARANVIIPIAFLSLLLVYLKVMTHKAAKR